MHGLASALARAAHAEVRIDEQQGLHGQILKFEVPGGVVRGDMRDVLHAVAGQPLPGIIIVQIGNALCVRATAAELADIVAQGGRADERDVDGKPGFLRALGGQRGDVVHADVCEAASNG